MADRTVDFTGADGVIFDPKKITDETIRAQNLLSISEFYPLQQEFARGAFLFREVIDVKPKRGENYQIITIKIPNGAMKISSYWLLPIFINPQKRCN